MKKLLLKDTPILLILDYEPPFALGVSVAKVAVFCTEAETFLRDLNAVWQAKGKKSTPPPWDRGSNLASLDLVWDIYGTDFETVELALAVLEKAPPPRKASITVSVPLNKEGRRK